MRTAALLVLLAAFGLAFGADEALTPPRLAYLDGTVSFWRAGAPQWSAARVNTPLAEGDRLYTGDQGNVEIQFGARAFLRAAARTEIALVNVEPDFLQFELKGGTASLDLRSLAAGTTIELDTPNAVFTVEHTGYYRAYVDTASTWFITRRAGRATVSIDGGAGQVLQPSEEVIVSGAAGKASIATYVAPEPDAWDRWNYARTDYESEAMSARYVSPGVYGVGALDQYGTWRVVPEYGAVWVPAGVAAGWTPYSTGSWVWDPYYGWTWIDDAPWGWAPFHYGRWVSVAGYWAWAPGPLLLRPVYAPALVAFFGAAPGVTVGVTIGSPPLRWVALGWGEPLHPWWGRPGFVGVPWWGGWAGPRVTNVVVYGNTRVPHGLVAREPKHFAPPRPIALRPPPHMDSRPVLATRAPRDARTGEAPRLIAPPARQRAEAPVPRPAFGGDGRERPRPAQPPRYEELRRAPGASASGGSAPARREPRALPGHPANQVQPGHAAPAGKSAAAPGHAASPGKSAGGRGHER